MKKRSATLIMHPNDVLFDYDLHLINVLNALKNRLPNDTWNEIANDAMNMLNSDEGSIYYRFDIDESNRLIGFKLGTEDDNPINGLNFQAFIYTKKNPFITKSIYDRLVDLGYKSTIEFTPILFKNVNGINALDTFNMFVVIDDRYSWSELNLVSNNFNGKASQILLRSKLSKWLEEHVDDNYTEKMLIRLTLMSNDEDIDIHLAELCNDIPQTKKELILCEARVITMSSRIDLEKLKALKESGANKRSNLGITKIFDLNIFR